MIRLFIKIFRRHKFCQAIVFVHDLLLLLGICYGTPKGNLIILGQLRDLCETYHERICGIESDKYDTEKEVEFKDYQITDLNIAVNDLRGKL